MIRIGILALYQRIHGSVSLHERRINNNLPACLPANKSNLLLPLQQHQFKYLLVSGFSHSVPYTG